MTISMISFGFAIYKILQQNHVEGAFFRGANTPRNVGLFLIDAGTIGILMGIVSYVRTLRHLRPLRHFRLMQPALAMALLISVFGTNSQRPHHGHAVPVTARCWDVSIRIVANRHSPRGAVRLAIVRTRLRVTLSSWDKDGARVQDQAQCPCNL